MITNYILLVIALMIVVTCEKCHWDSSSFKYFGGKTLYDDVRGDIRNVTKLNGNYNTFKICDEKCLPSVAYEYVISREYCYCCEPISIWLLSRHGSRNPSESNIDDMKKVMRFKDDILKSHAEGKGEMCDQAITSLQSWKWNETIDSTPYFLTSRGYRELAELGNRINRTFYTLLKDLHVHHIRATNEQRTIESSKSFLSGLDTKLKYKIQDPLEKNKDFLLLPYKNCEIYQKEVWNGATLKNGLQKCYDMEEYKKLLENLQRRTGILKPLTPSNVSALYDLCRFYRSFSETTYSPWCAVFTEQDLQIMEYIEDLRHYIRSSYGSSINLKLGKLVLADLLAKFQAAVYRSQPSFTAFFSHDSLIDMVYSALGLFRDEQGLSAEKRDPKRKWRASLSTPFGANFLGVLYKCKEPMDSSPYRVQFFANEKTLRVCEDACSWSAFEGKFKPFVNSSLSFCKIKTWI